MPEWFLRRPGRAVALLALGAGFERDADELAVAGDDVDPGPVDGIFGAKTESAVKTFQQAREIPADGVVGRVTWINIDEAD